MKKIFISLMMVSFVAGSLLAASRPTQPVKPAPEKSKKQSSKVSAKPAVQLKPVKVYKSNLQLARERANR